MKLTTFWATNSKSLILAVKIYGSHKIAAKDDSKWCALQSIEDAICKGLAQEDATSCFNNNTNL